MQGHGICTAYWVTNKEESSWMNHSHRGRKISYAYAEWRIKYTLKNFLKCHENVQGTWAKEILNLLM